MCFHTSFGEYGQIDANDVFVQGFSDAMLMAWNMVDFYSKANNEAVDPVCCTEGVEIPGLGFVDDLLEFSRSIFDTQISCVSDEVFQNFGYHVWETKSDQHRIT